MRDITRKPLSLNLCVFHVWGFDLRHVVVRLQLGSIVPSASSANKCQSPFGKCWHRNTSSQFENANHVIVINGEASLSHPPKWTPNREKSDKTTHAVKEQNVHRC